MKTRVALGSLAIFLLVVIASGLFFLFRTPAQTSALQTASSTPVVLASREATSTETGFLVVTLSYCYSEWAEQCAPIGAAGMCEGTSDASAANEYENHSIGIQAKWDTDNVQEQTRADELAGGYRIYYTVTADDEYGNQTIAIPRTFHSEVKHAPFNTPFSLGFIGVLRPLLYHLVIDIEPKNFPGQSYQKTVPLMIPSPETMASNPGFCPAFTNGSGSGII